MKSNYKETPILVIGNGKLCYSVSVSLLEAGHPVSLVTQNINEAIKTINGHLFDLSRVNPGKNLRNLLKVSSSPDSQSGFKIGIAITAENLLEKRSIIQKLEKNLAADSIIAINTESIPLSTLQEGCEVPGRLFGLNWVEPAHTTFFLELITNSKSNKKLADNLFQLAKISWKKDPYLISSDVSIRAKLLSVMAREAFYLVENGYASIEDIDRACRNDAGYYLPFSGNFRYMDLMGTYAYGLVMKDLNRELSKESEVPHFFEEIIEQGGLGMENNKGFYNYEEEDVKQWMEVFAKFSYQIKDIISKYPFKYTKALADNKLI
jgi:3-hydroxybutyryl-CoA dehydrogenase